MSQAYSDPERENDPNALPDVEIFYISEQTALEWAQAENKPVPAEPGWYFWHCFPGCLPDSEAEGPYATEEEALAAAQDIS